MRETSLHGKAVFDGPARPCCRSGDDGRHVLSRGRCAFRGGAEFGDQVGTALSQYGQRHAEPDGRGRSNILSGATRDRLLERVTRDFTLRGLVAELGGRGVKVDYVQVWRFAHAQGLSFQKKACCPPNSSAQPLHDAGRSGESTKAGLIRPGWSSYD